MIIPEPGALDFSPPPVYSVPAVTGQACPTRVASVWPSAAPESSECTDWTGLGEVAERHGSRA